ncbi:hypothetical protein EON63_14820 [archaeon]|nr:MAG: hypothetical protein EON63_14820 [archaeon]
MNCWNKRITYTLTPNRTLAPMPQVAAEKTSATLHSAAEQMRPHLTVMQRQLSEASSSTWKFLSAAALQAADYTSKVWVWVCEGMEWTD